MTHDVIDPAKKTGEHYGNRLSGPMSPEAREFLKTGRGKLYRATREGDPEAGEFLTAGDWADYMKAVGLFGGPALTYRGVQQEPIVPRGIQVGEFAGELEAPGAVNISGTDLTGERITGPSTPSPARDKSIAGMDDAGLSYDPMKDRRLPFKAPRKDPLDLYDIQEEGRQLPTPITGAPIPPPQVIARGTAPDAFTTGVGERPKPETRPTAPLFLQMLNTLGILVDNTGDLVFEGGGRIVEALDSMFRTRTPRTEKQMAEFRAFIERWKNAGQMSFDPIYASAEDEIANLIDTFEQRLAEGGGQLGEVGMELLQALKDYYQSKQEPVASPSPDVTGSNVRPPSTSDDMKVREALRQLMAMVPEHEKRLEDADPKGTARLQFSKQLGGLRGDMARAKEYLAERSRTR